MPVEFWAAYLLRKQETVNIILYYLETENIGSLMAEYQRKELYTNTYKWYNFQMILHNFGPPKFVFFI